ncbi:MAG: GntR family transcriptional regulator [Anaerolineaceae bacterium]|nr:GntR family transcriptional regulator [Anaerolineaceae bacterium]
MDTQKPIAVYLQIRNDLLSEIMKNGFKDGKLPSEAELCTRYDVSRMTVNKALTLLAHDGIIERKKGKGTYIRPRQVNKVLEESVSFSEDIQKLGSVPGSVLLSYKTIKAAKVPLIANWLSLESSDTLYYFQRLRTVDQKPIAISQTYLSRKVVPDLPISCLEKSLYGFLKNELNIRPVCSDYLIQAKLPTSWESEMLKTSREALLSVAHLSFTEDGHPFEYNETSYLGSKYIYLSNPLLQPVGRIQEVNFTRKKRVPEF